jgi:serine/threonine protein kinase
MGLSVQNVYGLLLRSKLLAANDAKSLYERWQKEARDSANDLERFRRWMIGHHYLTDYQANLLCKGHADGFFISDYKVLDRLGRGRMAGVYKAVHNTGQIVAIKVLPPSRAKVAYLLQRFEREARLAIQLKHPNVVRTFQVGVADGLNFIVMEYLEGETLDDVLYRRRRLPPNEAVRLIWQAFYGLQHIHERGMVHRDLKPSNMMLTPARAPGQADSTINASVKILDIGLGRMFFDENAPTVDERDQDQLTGEGVLLGTPDYLPPEQARDARGVDIRADIYSMGCVLYHCLSGGPPFPDTNIINQIMRHAQETPRPLKEFNAEVSDALQQVIGIMMAKDANLRYATPLQAAQALQPFVPGATEPARLNEDAQLKQYLAWLENRINGLPAVNRPNVRGASVAEMAPKHSSGKDSKSGRNRHSKHGSHRWRKKKKKNKELPVAVPVAPPPGWTGEYDVELVPVEGQPDRKQKADDAGPTGSSGLAWLWWVLGAIGVATAIGLGALAAYFTQAGQ